LKEAVTKDPDLGEQAWNEMINKGGRNAFIQRWMKEAVLSDVSQALGSVYSRVVEASRSMAVGRDIISIVNVTDPTVRFYKATKGKAFRVSELADYKAPERFSYTDITVDYEYAYPAAFSKSYIEDVPFDVLQRATADIGRALEKQLTSDIISLYEGISASNLAGGGEISADTNGTLAWADLIEAIETLKDAGYPDGQKVAVINPAQMMDLWGSDQFISSLYPARDSMDYGRGVVGDLPDGVKIVETDLCTATKVHVINLDYAAVCLMRRDITVEPWEKPDELLQGVIGTIRYGLGTLREDAVARIVSC